MTGGRHPAPRNPRGLRAALPAFALALVLVGCGGPAGIAPPATPTQGPEDGPAVVPTALSPDELAEALAPPPAIRPEVSGLHGAVVAGHPLAAAAGYEVLRAGGNATDAAVTMAGVLAVVRPHMNGVGGDAFGLFYSEDARQVRALNASGRAARAATPAWFAERDVTSMPGSGALAVTVPGAVSAWEAALEAYGTITLAEALAPAIRLAEEGFVVTRTLAADLGGALRLNQAGRDIYAPGGERMREGDLLRSPALGAALRRISEEGSRALYGGEVGQALVRFLQSEGSPLASEDFAAHTPEWMEPASIPFMGRTVHATPPNSQGIVLLQMLGMLEARGIRAESPFDPAYLHVMAEARKLAFADRDRWVADPATDPAPLGRLLSPAYLAERARLIGDEAAGSVEPGFGAGETGGEPASGDGDTVYLLAVDADGNAVSWIQSLFAAFGSRLVDPATGIVLQNRGAGFTLEEGHPNRIAPGKRPFHTLMATMVTDADGRFEVAIGTPGGHGQSQTVAQGLMQMFAFGMSPQQAAEAPRFRGEGGRRMLIESRMPAPTLLGLADRGHSLSEVDGWTATFGGLQIIRREANGLLRTGADMRREAASMAY
jgi:gamma-glutamyltranspeptidase / glutathione hydrolase